MNLGGSSNDYRQVESLFQRVMDLSPEQRVAFLDDQCGDDVELRRHVETLIRHHAAVPETYLSPALDDSGPIPPAVEPPRRIGHYEIVRSIGQGGMGVVFEARQENPRRAVAVKVIRSRLASAESRRRFEYEATLLGRLQHPGIAHVYESGVSDVTEAGGRIERWPFFAMELIHGVPLQEFVRATPDLRARIELFTQICDAVEHAHQKGVIHRDLKPANILVTATGQPKILDFGVARATDGDGPMTTMHTQAEQVLGTIPYMSPEQVGGRVDQLDTRSDVYSLGVILYEMLAGRLPHEIRGQNLVSAARVINEQPPAPLSTQNRALRGDLETIVHKGLEKDPSHRYQSVAALAADLRRHLNHEPIAARPPSFWYQLSKLARRRRGLMAGAALVTLAVLAGTAVAGWQALRATRAERTSRAVNDFFNQDLLARANPYNEPDRDVSLREVLDRAATRLEGRFADDPLVEISIRQTLGVTYHQLGELPAAEQHLRRALELAQRELGEDDRETIRISLELGDALRKAFRLDEAGQILQSAAIRAEAAFGADDYDTLEARNNLAVVALKRNQPAEAESIARQTLAIRREKLGDNHGATLVSMSTLGSALERQGKFAEAEPLYIECLERSRKSIGNEHPDTMTAIRNLGLFYSRLDRFAEAEPHVLEAFELHRRVLGEEHDSTLAVMNNVGYFDSVQKRFSECEPHYVNTYEIRRRKLGAEHPDTLLSMNNLGWLYTQLQRWTEAEQLLSEMVEISRRAQAGSMDLDLSLQTLGGFLVKRDRAEEAEPLLREALDGLRTHAPEGDWRIGGIMTTYGNCLRRLKRFDEAESNLLEGHRRQLGVLGPAHQQTKLSIEALVNLYTDWNKPDQVAEWKAKFPPSAEPRP